MSYEEAVAGTQERLTRSVELRLRADVPIAFSLSGGIDSPALIAIAKRKLGYDVHGFTIMNTDARYEERDMVELVVRERRRAPHRDSRRTRRTSCPTCASWCAITTPRCTPSPTTRSGR